MSNVAIFCAYHRVQMTEGKRNIIHQLLEEYDIQSAEDIQNAMLSYDSIALLTIRGEL